MNHHVFLLPLTVAALLAAPTAGYGEAAPSPAAESGKTLFEETAGDTGCAVCHGVNARGEGLAPDIRDSDVVRVKDSLANTGDMDYFHLTDSEIDDIVAYLAYLWKKAGH